MCCKVQWCVFVIVFMSYVCFVEYLRSNKVQGIRLEIVYCVVKLMRDD